MMISLIHKKAHPQRRCYMRWWFEGRVVSVVSVVSGSWTTHSRWITIEITWFVVHSLQRVDCKKTQKTLHWNSVANLEFGAIFRKYSGLKLQVKNVATLSGVLKTLWCSGVLTWNHVFPRPEVLTGGLCCTSVPAATFTYCWCIYTLWLRWWTEGSDDWIFSLNGFEWFHTSKKTACPITTSSLFSSCTHIWVSQWLWSFPLRQPSSVFLLSSAIQSPSNLYPDRDVVLSQYCEDYAKKVWHEDAYQQLIPRNPWTRPLLSHIPLWLFGVVLYRPMWTTSASRVTLCC